jgi:exosome complex component CSL4
MMSLPSPVPSLRHNLGSTVVPGDKIGRIIVDSATGAEKIMLSAGPGTYIRGGQIYSSMVGTLRGSHIAAHSDDVTTGTSSARIATIMLQVEPSRGFFAQQDVLSVGQVVLGRVVRVQSSQQQAIVTILAVQNVEKILSHHPEGVIRKEDVRTSATEKQIQIQNSFRSNDLIIARILSLGDSRRYFLSTQEPSLGVIHAISSVSQKPMIPISWKEMECPETGVKESRKCARPPNFALPSSELQKTDSE